MHNRPIQMTADELLIWSAGFFDGEGCINISKQSRKYGRNRDLTSINYGLNVSVCQKDPRPLEILHDMFGGHFYSYDVKGNTYWRWHIWSHMAVRMLNAVQPYLILKQDRADIGMDFHFKLTKWNRDYGRRGYPDWVNVERESYYQQMKSLNMRGVSLDNPNPKTPGVKKGAPNHFNRPKIGQKGESVSIQ